MYFRYSSRVVAPISWISPLERDGFRILDASRAPSAPPAPIIVCSSSINRRTPLFSLTSLTTLRILSSNSPRYLLPATIPDKSSTTTLLFFTVSGTIPDTIFWARPSAIAVFPTPGSPTRQGLFFVLLLKIWIRRAISLSLPTTGSSFPSAAIAVRSRLYWSSTGVPEPFRFFRVLAGCIPSAPVSPSAPIAASTETYSF